VPSSKVGSCDSASAAAERDSGVEAGVAGLTAAWAGAAMAGLGFGATGIAAGPLFWPNAGQVASNIAETAKNSVVRMAKSPRGAEKAGVDQ
jgi:hypothetical protein